MTNHHDLIDICRGISNNHPSSELRTEVDPDLPDFEGWVAKDGNFRIGWVFPVCDYDIVSVFENNELVYHVGREDMSYWELERRDSDVDLRVYRRSSWEEKIQEIYANTYQ